MSTLSNQMARMEAAKRLSDAGIDTAPLDARLLLAHTLGISQTQLLMRDLDPISSEHLTRFETLIDRRAAGEPLAYLTGEREFMGLAFHTTPDVLVPRPDTEPLVEWGLRWLAQHPHANIADIGTGSGAIAIALTHHAPPNWTGRTIATDISHAALTVAEGNANALLGPERRDRIAFRSGRLTDPLDAPVDLILTNLPYLTPEQVAENPDLAHEPRLALVGGDDGLDLVRMVVDDLHRVLAPGGAIGFEIDPSQSDELQRLLHQALPHHRVEVVFDLAGDERHIVTS